MKLRPESCLGLGCAAPVPWAMSRMSDTHALAVGKRPAPCPTKIELCSALDETWPGSG